MDGVILAAGRGSRLDGITAPFHKPLLVIKRTALVVNAYDCMLEWCDRIFIVVAPENALPISQVLGDREVTMIVQRDPRGPGDALDKVLHLTNAGYALVVMGDNYVTASDVKEVADNEGMNVIGVEEVPHRYSTSYTWYNGASGGWVEKVRAVSSAPITAWVGPIRISISEMRIALRKWRDEQHSPLEVPIGPLFNELSDIIVAYVSTLDIGTPEALS